MNPIAAAAGALKFVSTFSQYKWKSAYSNYEAKLLEENARLVAAQTAEEEARFRRGFNKFQGSVNVARAKSGVSESGSFSWIQESNTQAAELDAMTVKYNGLIKEIGLRQASTLKKAEATMYRRQALFNSVIEGVSMGASVNSMLRPDSTTSTTSTSKGGLLTQSGSAPSPGSWNYTL